MPEPVLVKRILTYQRVIDPEEQAILTGLGPADLQPENTIVVKCLETGLAEPLCYSEEEFNFRYQVYDQ